ncbi:MAG TPA: hypothetical protein VGF48_23115 [Thermoanaerobaculia bacterium]|jgi:hypothetical protein
MTELEVVTTRKKQAAKAAVKKSRVGKVVGGAALGVVAAVAAHLAKRRQKSFDGVIVPESVLPDRSHAAVAATATREAMQAIVDASLTPEEVAASIGVGAAAVTRRIHGRTLYAFQVRQCWLVPKFQFSDAQTLPGIEKIIPRLDRDLHPIEVVNWFTYPHVDLVMGDVAVSPVEWLKAGRNAEMVMALADELGSGF